MRYEAGLLLALLTGACSIYDKSLGTGGVAGDSQTVGGTSTGGSGAGGVGGTDIGASAGGAPMGAGTSGIGGAGTAGERGSGGASTGAGGDSTGDGGSAGATAAGGGGGSNPSAGAGGLSAGGASGVGGASGAGGSESGGSAGSGMVTDAGNDAPQEASAGAICAPGTCKRVFVSLESPAPKGKLGSVAAVDTFCQTAADAKGLGGTWRAWISDTSSSPSTRFTRATVPYRLLDGNTIAANFTALTSGTLQHAINIHEDGKPVPPAAVYEVWTGTRSNGTYSGNACANWTNDTAMPPTGDVGVTSVTNVGWTNIYQQYCDRTAGRVYCFEQ